MAHIIWIRHVPPCHHQMANKSAIAKFFTAVLAKMDKTVLYMAEIRTSHNTLSFLYNYVTSYKAANHHQTNK